MQKIKFLTLVLAIFCCFVAQGWAVVNPEPYITDVITQDLNQDGRIDQVLINFSEAVDVVDGDAQDGFAPLVLDVGFKVAPGDYSATNVTSLTLDIIESSRPNSGMVTGATYDANTGKGSVVSVGTALEVQDQAAFTMGADGVPPVITEIFNIDAASGELFIRFSEPIKNSLSSLLTISDFDYIDNSSGNAISISAMGSEVDGSSGLIRVFLNSALSINDLTLDQLSPVGLTDDAGNALDSTPVGITGKDLFGTLVQVDLGSPASVGLGVHNLLELDLFSYVTQTEVSEIEFSVNGASSIENLELWDIQGNLLSTIQFPNEGLNNFIFSNNLIVNLSSQVHLTGNVLDVPVAGNLQFSVDPQTIVVNNAPNAGTQGTMAVSVEVIDAMVGPTEIELLSDVNFITNSDLYPTSNNQDLIAFDLNVPANTNFSGLTVSVNAMVPVSDIITGATLYIDGSAVGAGTVTTSGVDFTFSHSGAQNQHWSVNFDIASTVNSGMGTFEVAVGADGIFADKSVIGMNISYYYILNGVISGGGGVQGMVYGPLPGDDGLERVTFGVTHEHGFIPSLGGPGEGFRPEISIITSSDVTSAQILMPSNNLATFDLLGDVIDGGNLIMFGLSGEMSETFAMAITGDFADGAYQVQISADGVNYTNYDVNITYEVNDILPMITSPENGEGVETQAYFSWDPVAVDFYELSLAAKQNNRGIIFDRSYSIGPDQVDFMLPQDDVLPSLANFDAKLAAITVTTNSGLQNSDNFSIVTEARNVDGVSFQERESVFGGVQVDDEALDHIGFGYWTMSNGSNTHYGVVLLVEGADISDVTLQKPAGVNAFPLDFYAEGSYGLMASAGNSMSALSLAFPAGTYTVSYVNVISQETFTAMITLDTFAPDTVSDIELIYPLSTEMLSPGQPLQLQWNSASFSNVDVQRIVSQIPDQRNVVFVAPGELQNLDIGIVEPLSSYSFDVQNMLVKSTDEGVAGSDLGATDNFTLVKFDMNREGVTLMSRGRTGAVALQENSGFVNPGILQDGQIGAQVLSAFLTTDSGSVNVNDLTFMATNENMDLLGQVSAATLTILTDGVSNTITGALSTNSIIFSGPFTVPAGVPVKITLSVDVLQFPAYGFLDFEIKGRDVNTDLGRGFSDAPIISHLQIGEGVLGTVLVRDARFEIGPDIHEINSSANLSAVFNFVAGPSDAGFDTVELDVPDDLSSLSNFVLGTAGDENATVFAPLTEGSDYTVVYDDILNVVTISYMTTQTIYTSNGGFYKFDFTAMTGPDESLVNHFDLILYNTQETSPDFFATADSTVNADLINDAIDPASIQIRFLGTPSENLNVSDAVAEVDAFPTSLLDSVDLGIASADNVGLKFFVEGEVGANDLGFDIIRISYPQGMSVDLGSIVIEVADSLGSYSVMSGVSTVSPGQLRIQLGSAITSVGMNFLSVELSLFTGNESGSVNFKVELSNSVNPTNTIVASMGNAEPSTLDVGKWNGLSLPILQDQNLPTGTALAALQGEVETALGYAVAGQDVSVSLNLSALLNDEFVSGVGYNVMEIDFPYGFTLKGSIVLSTDGSSQVASSFASVSLISADSAIGQLAGAKINFSSTQNSGNLFITGTFTAPELEAESIFDVSAFNTGYLYSETYASPEDIDKDNMGGSLNLRSVVEQSSLPNLTGAIFEVDVVDGATPRLGADLGLVQTNETPAWRVFVEPQILAGDQGFNVIRFDLPVELMDGLPSDIRVFKTVSANITTASSWDLLANGTQYDVVDMDSWSFRVKFRQVQTDPDSRYIVTFRRTVTSTPNYLSLDVVLDNTTNFREVYAEVGNADGDDNDRNDSGFGVEGTLSTIPNASSAYAQVVKSGNILTGTQANFSLLLNIQVEAGDEGVNTIDVNYPVDISSIKVISIAAASSLSGLSSNVLSSSLYQVANRLPGALEIDFAQVQKTSKIFKINFQATMPSTPLYADFDVKVDNNNNANALNALSFPINTAEPESLGFEVKPSYNIEDLLNIVVDSSAEVLVTPSAGNTFVTPGSSTRMNVVLKAKVDSTVAGFNVLIIDAPDGFTLPQNYVVYKAPTVASLGNSEYRLSSDKMVINKDSLANGSVKFTFSNTQNISTLSEANGYTDGIAYFRIDFTPTAPNFETNGFVSLSLNNTANPKEFYPFEGAVANASELGLTAANIIDTDGLSVEVYFPYDENAKPVVADLEAEVNVAVGSGNYKGSIEMSTEGSFRVDIRPEVPNTTDYVGIDTLAIELPFGFSAPSAISVTKYTLVGSNYVSSSVLNESVYKSDVSRLMITLKSGVDTDATPHYYRVAFKSTTFDYSSEAYFNISVDNSSKPNDVVAFPADVDGVVNNNGLSINVQPKALTEIGNYFTPVADSLLLEVSPQIADVSATAKEFSVYVKAGNVTGQRGFNRLDLSIPYDFSNVSNVTVSRFTGVTVNNTTGFTPLAIGSGLSFLKAFPSDSVYGNMIRADFSALVGVESDAILKVVFSADMPNYVSSGTFIAEVDDKSKSLPKTSTGGDASILSTTNSDVVFVEAGNVDFNAQLLTDFTAEVAAGNVLNTTTGILTGEPVATQASYVDVLLKATKNVGDSGFDFLEIFMPYPIDGNRLTVTEIKVASAQASSYVGPESFVRIDPTTLIFKKTDASVSIKFKNGAFATDGTLLFRVRIPVVAPDESGLYSFDLRAFSSSVAGIDEYPAFGDAVPNLGNDSLDVNVLPYIDENFDATVFPVASLLAEIMPNAVPSSQSARFTVISSVTVDGSNSGFNQIKVVVPPGFGKPNFASIKIDAIDAGNSLLPSLYSVKTADAGLIITLVSTVSTSGNVRIAFDSVAPLQPGDGTFELWAGLSTQTLLALPATWADVDTAANQGNGSLKVGVYPDYNNITFVDPVDELYGEVTVVPVDGSTTVFTNSLARVKLYARAQFTTGSTAGGFNLLNIELPSGFGSFPSKVGVIVGSDNLLAGSSTGFDLDTTDALNPVIKFKQNYTSDKDIIVTFDIQVPADASEYEINFSLDKLSVPSAVSAIFGVQDLNGNNDDQNGNSVFVFPKIIEVADNVYVVDEVLAEVVASDLKVNEGAAVAVFAKVINTSGNGFDRLRVRKNEKLGFSSIKSVQKLDAAGAVVKTFVKDVDFTVIPESNRVRILFKEVQCIGTGAVASSVYKVVLNVNAPDAPMDLRFDVVVDNAVIVKPQYAFPGDIDGITTNRNNLLMKVIQDYSALLTGGATTLANNLTSLSSETVVLKSSGYGKNAIAGSSNTVRVYIRPEFTGSDRGVDKFSIQLPAGFGKPANIAVYSTNVSGTTKLDNNAVDYRKTVSDDLKIEIDFSVAQKEKWRLLNSTNTESSTVVFTVEFQTTMPENSGKYFIIPKADNKSVSLPKEAVASNLNNNSDDDGDSLLNGLNDNTRFILVEPVKVDASTYSSRVNAAAVVSELLGQGNDQLGKTIEMSIVTKVTMGSSGNINRLRLKLPDGFNNVTSMKVVKIPVSTGIAQNLVEITDYTVDAANPALVRLRFTQSMIADVVIKATFNVTLPSRSDSFNLAVEVDNSLAPKAVEAIAGDAIPGVGLDSLYFFVDPASYNEADLLKSMMTSFTAKVSTPSSMLVNESTKVTMLLTPTFVLADVGFNLLNIEGLGLSGMTDFLILTKAGAQDMQLFEGINYSVNTTSTGVSIHFTTPFDIDSAIDSIQISFTATSGTDPLTAKFSVAAASTTLPLVTKAVVANGGSLDLKVQPAPKSTAELKKRPARPVASLQYDVAQLSGNALSTMNVDIFIKATSAAGTTLDNEIIPASSGFDLLSVTMPKTFGAVSQLRLLSYASSNYVTATELQLNADFTYTVDQNNVVSISLSKELMGKSGSLNSAFLKISMATSLPAQPQTTNIFVSVNNSRDLNEVKAAEAELNSADGANRKIVVNPLANNVLATLVSEAKATVVYAQDGNGDVKADVGQSSYGYTIRLAATAANGGVGFDVLNIDLPKKFKDVLVSSIKVVRSGVESSVAPGTQGYIATLDTARNLMVIKFGSAQAVGSTAFSYMDIGLVAKIPLKKKQYNHSLSIFNSSSATSLSVTPNIVTGAVGETGKLAIEVIKKAAQAKYGVYGNLSGNVLSAFTGSVSAWDDHNTVDVADDTFAGSIYHLPEARNVLIQTTPVIAAGDDGFDYLQIDLPYGSGTPSNVVVFYRSAAGNIVYLEEFYDFDADVSTSELSVKFSSVVNATTLSTSGVFLSKLGENIAAQNLFVSFEMTMPNRLGKHFFDVFVINSVTKSDAYYVDDANNVNLRPLVSTVVTRSADEDGTRFMYIDQMSRTTSTPAVASALAEVTTQDQFTSDLTLDARRTIRFDLAVVPGSSNTYDLIEIQLPEDFNTVSNVKVDEGSTSLKQYRDFNLDLEHPRSLVVALLSKRNSASQFTITFDIQTPAIIPTNLVTYNFGVVVGDQETVSLTKQAVFASPADVTINNAGSGLGLVLNNVITIGGSILLAEPALGEVTGSIALSMGSTSYPVVNFTLASGETSAIFVLTNQNISKNVINWDNGTYNLVVSLDQFKTITQSVTVSSLAISNLFVSLPVEDVQAAMTLSPAFVSTYQTDVAVQMLVNVHLAAGNTLNTLEMPLPATSGFAITSVSVGNTLLSTNNWSVVSGTLSANLGLVSADNIVIHALVSTDSTEAQYPISANVSTNSGFSVLAKDSSAMTNLPSLSVGQYLNISTTSLPTGLLGTSYGTTIAYSYDNTRISDVTFVATGLPTGLTLNTAGVLSGAPAQSNKDGFTVTITASGNGYSDSKVYTLRVYKAGYAVYGIQPAVVPTTGGEVIVRGIGFTVASNVYLDSTLVSSVYVNQNTLRATIPATTAGTYSLYVEDGGEYVGVPNPVNDSQLLVATASNSTATMSATVEDGVAAKITDYDIVGLKSFYQGSVQEKLVSAFGAQDINKWRVFGYDQGYYEIQTQQESASRLRPGSGFWRISRVSGNVDTSGINPEAVASYDIVIAPNQWSLISNVYNTAVAWTDVHVLSGNLSNPVNLSVENATDYINTTLWGMKKDSTDPTRPYAASATLEPGKGYWVYNKSAGFVALRINKPSSQLVKASVEPRLLYKANENLPPEAPESYQKASLSTSSASGGGGCLLK